MTYYELIVMGLLGIVFFVGNRSVMNAMVLYLALGVRSRGKLMGSQKDPDYHNVVSTNGKNHKVLLGGWTKV